MRGNLDMNIRYVDATDRFLAELSGVTDPEEKRRDRGQRVHRASSRPRRRAWAGSTSWPRGRSIPTSSSRPRRRRSRPRSKIKTHHNVGGLPPDLRFQLIEPLRYLFKDEVRAVGLELGLPEEMVYRQPFPGPGLAIRCSAR